MRAFPSPRREIPRARVGPSVPGAHEAPGTLTRIEPVELLAGGLERGEAASATAPTWPAPPAPAIAPQEARGARARSLQRSIHRARAADVVVALALASPPPPPGPSRIQREIEEFVPSPEPLGLHCLQRQQRLKPACHAVGPLQLSSCLLRRANPPSQKGARGREPIIYPGVAQGAHSTRDGSSGDLLPVGDVVSSCSARRSRASSSATAEPRR